MGTKEKGIVEVQGSNPAAVIKHAIKTGASIEEMAKLLELQERFDANEARKAYHNAMAAFKANPPKINKDKEVSYNNVNYKHASLANVVEKISAELSKHGLSVSWETDQNGKVVVTCKITHRQGHSEQTRLSADADASGSKNKIQAIGSTVTYLQRYTLLAITGLATYDGDDDAQSAAVEYIDEKQQNQIIDLLIDTGSDEEKFCEFFKIEDVSRLPKAKYNEAMIAINSKKKGKKDKK